MQTDYGQLRVSEELLAKYNRPGPRYTSYPTAPVWSDQFSVADAEEVFQQADARGGPVSLYLHLPFCESLCLFCACNVVISKNKDVAPAYLNTLQQEIERVARFVSPDRQVIQHHWGGGTPTYLSPGQLAELFEFTRAHFSIAADAEMGVEVDPRVTTTEHLETLRRLGFNRLSMGVQDFEPLVQQTIHRVQPYEMTRDMITAARTLGFASINVDLIYGLPHQTAASFVRTIEQVLTMRPDRIAMFSYAHVPWLKKQQGSFVKFLPEGMQKFDIFRAGLQRFIHAGYLYIGMDHFALPGDELAVARENRTLHRNFQGYTTKAGADLYGMGVSAISGVGTSYVQNFRTVPEYYNAVAQRGLATMRGYRLNRDDEIRRALISRLLCHGVIDICRIENEFQIVFDDYFARERGQLQELAGDGLLEIDADQIRVTPLGMIFIRNVGMVFDGYLPAQTAGEPRALFSKTL